MTDWRIELLDSLRIYPTYLGAYPREQLGRRAQVLSIENLEYTSRRIDTWETEQFDGFPIPNESGNIRIVPDDDYTRVQYTRRLQPLEIEDIPFIKLDTVAAAIKVDQPQNFLDRIKQDQIFATIFKKEAEEPEATAVIQPDPVLSSVVADPEEAELISIVTIILKDANEHFINNALWWGDFDVDLTGDAWIQEEPHFVAPGTYQCVVANGTQETVTVTVTVAGVVLDDKPEVVFD